MLRFLSAGESHGRCLLAVLEGLPAGLQLNQGSLNRELGRRQRGYGRGGRMKIEKDEIEILSGIRKTRTTGAPLGLLIKNRDYQVDGLSEISSPRPGHGDLAGALKYDSKDIRDILERASARETAMRVAVGALCKAFLSEFKIQMTSHVVCIGSVCAGNHSISFAQIRQMAESSCLMCADKLAERKMIDEIDHARKQGDSLGGIFEVLAVNLPPGLGNFIQWDRRLDAQLAAAVMSIPAVKAVEIGAGFAGSRLPGSQFHDAIFYTASKSFFRKTNRAGGLEAGMTNGEPLVLRGAMKPIATLPNPLTSVNIKNKRIQPAAVERADVCAVAAAGVVAEAMIAFCLARACLEKFGGDSLGETKRNYQGYLKQIKKF